MIDTQGKLLVAPPNMTDWRFQKSVIYMWKHDVAGANGIIINKKCQHPDFRHVCMEGNVKIKDNIDAPVYYGGPVLTNVVGVLHSTEYRLPTTNRLAEGNVGFTLDSKILEDVARGKGPLNTMITLGMANWNASQLEEEIEHPHAPGMSWLLLDYDEKLVFGQLEDAKPDEIWEDCVSVSYTHLTLPTIYSV